MSIPNIHSFYVYTKYSLILCLYQIFTIVLLPSRLEPVSVKTIIYKFGQESRDDDYTINTYKWTILISLDSFPLSSQRTRTVLYSPDISTGSKPRPPVQHVTAVSRVDFLFSFFHKKDISWVIIRIKIKMKSSALLPSNLPRVIDRSNLSPRRFAARW